MTTYNVASHFCQALHAGVNSDPVASAGTQVMNEDEVLNCNSTGCAVTASDPDGQWDTLTLSILTQAVSGED